MKAILRTVLCAMALAALMASPVHAQDNSERVFELRTYKSAPGRLDDLVKRFADHTVGLFEKHGMTNIGYWTPTDEDLAADTLIYLLAHDSREAASASWRAFGQDPEWRKVSEASNANGSILLSVDSKYMTPTDFSALK